MARTLDFHLNSSHDFVSKRDYLFISRSFCNCPVFKHGDIEERAKLIEKHKACVSCLSWEHQRDACPASNHAYNNDGCTLFHSRWIHDSTVNYCNHLAFDDALDDKASHACLLEVVCVA